MKKVKHFEEFECEVRKNKQGFKSNYIYAVSTNYSGFPIGTLVVLEADDGSEIPVFTKLENYKGIVNFDTRESNSPSNPKKCFFLNELDGICSLQKYTKLKAYEKAREDNK